MIRSIQIQNFKSVQDLELELGRVTVLIGANGSGKSNILECFALAAAASAGKLAHEFLSARGIRMPEDIRLLFSVFSEDHPDEVDFRFKDEEAKAAWLKIAPIPMVSTSLTELHVKDGYLPYTKNALEANISLIPAEMTLNSLKNSLENQQVFTGTDKELVIHALESFLRREEYNVYEPFVRALISFQIYAPENRELRTFAEEGQIRPLGIRGEGLFRLLKILAQQGNGAKLAILKEKLQLIDWFEDFEFQQDAMAYERRLLIRDRHLTGDLAYFDQRSANEGFLFLLFYFCLFLSDATPPFFAIDNIDSSLNPKLCTRLMQELVQLAKDNGKQVILTTHNPAILDGLDLNDDEQRLYTVRRNRNGETIAERIHAPKVQEGQTPIRLSDAYLRGLLGGLPTNF